MAARSDITSPGWLEAGEAALNAVLGDYLEREGSELAIRMAFYHHARPLALTAAALRAAHPNATARICVLVHGMGHTEASWSFPGEPTVSYGSLLQRDVGVTPFYLRYNSGRHISQNGRELAERLEQLIEAYPVAVEEISLLGHSMGGLVIRSACHYAAERSLSWIERTRRAFYVGSPHLGAPLEKGGHLVSRALSAIDDPVVRLIGAVADLRSAGVKDLRHGSLLDEDWQPSEAGTPARPRPVPLRAHMDHYLIAGTLTKNEAHVFGKLLGDALVRVPSALDPGVRAGLPRDHLEVFPGVHHVGLLHHPEVYARIRGWFGDPDGVARAGGPAVRGASPAIAPAPLDARARADAYRALVHEAIDKGAAAVQGVQEELTARPYDLLEQVPPLEGPTRAVRTAHFAALRATYGAVRLVNRAVSAGASIVLRHMR